MGYDDLVHYMSKVKSYLIYNASIILHRPFFFHLNDKTSLIFNRTTCVIAASCVYCSSLERASEVAFSKNDNRMEEHSVIPNTFYHIPHPQ